MLRAININRLSAYALWAGLFFWTVILVFRRNSQAFTDILPLFAFCLVLVVFTCLSLLALMLFLNWRPGNKPISQSHLLERNHIVPIIVTATLPFVVGISIPAEQNIFAIIFSLGITTVIILAAFAMTGQLPLWIKAAAERVGVLSETDRLAEQDIVNRDVNSQTIEVEQDFDSEEYVEHLQLQQTRFFDEQGQDCLSGIIKGELPAGQKQLMLHLQFHPPFTSLPTLEIHLLDDVDVRLKVGTVYCYGARIEARRSGSADSSEEFRVEYLAYGNANQADSA